MHRVSWKIERLKWCRELRGRRIGRLDEPKSPSLCSFRGSIDRNLFPKSVSRVLVQLVLADLLFDLSDFQKDQSWANPLSAESKQICSAEKREKQSCKGSHWLMCYYDQNWLVCGRGSKKLILHIDLWIPIIGWERVPTRAAAMPISQVLPEQARATETRFKARALVP